MSKVRLLDTDGLPYSDEDIAMMHPEVVEELLREQNLGDTIAEMRERGERRARAPVKRKRKGTGPKTYRVVLVWEEEGQLIKFGYTSTSPEKYIQNLQEGNSRTLEHAGTSDNMTYRQVRDALDVLMDEWEIKQYGYGWYHCSEEELEGILAQNQSEEIENSRPENSSPED